MADTLRSGQAARSAPSVRAAPVCLLACLLLLLGSGPQWAAASDEWSGWRGADRQGRAAGTSYPVHWSPTSGILWRTRIPGEGHSSPIVAGDAVYVSTAWMVPISRPLLTASRIGQSIVLGLVLALGAWAVGRALRRDRPGGWVLLALGSRVALLALLAFAVLFGERLLDFGIGGERPWIAACVVGTVALSLVPAPAPAGGRGRLLGGIVLLAFAGLMGALVPGKERTIAVNPAGDASMVVYAVLALPGLLGIARAGAGIRELGTVGQGRTAAVLAGIGEALGVAAKVGLGLLLGTTWRLVVGQRAVSGASVSTFDLHAPVTAWWWVAVAAGVLGLLLGASKRRRSPPGFGVLAVMATGVLIGTAAVVGVDHLLARERYVWYLVHTGRFEPMLGRAAVLALSGLSVAALLASAVVRKGRLVDAGLRIGVVASSLALTGLYLAYALFQPKTPHMERAIVSVDRESGVIRWISHGLRGDRGSLHPDNSPASPTPVTDGRRVYAYFGTPGLLCTDLRGDVLWQRTDLPFESVEGAGSSPALCDGKVVILSESDAGCYVAAVDAASGRTAWRVDRHRKTHSYAGNCRTPSVLTIGGKRTIVVWGVEDITGYDPLDGRELWTRAVESVGKGDNPVASLIADGGFLYLVGRQKAICLEAAKLPGTADAMVWSRDTSDGAQCPSPLVKDDLLVEVSDSGVAQCLDARSGRPLWRHELGQQHYASPVLAGGMVYLCSTKGRTTVVALAHVYRETAVSELGQKVYASFAAADGSLYVRSFTHLYRMSPGAPR